MPACSNCGKDTELYYHNFPLCIDGSASGMLPDRVLPEHAKEDSSEVPPQQDPLD
jgi:hypothetical protein